MKVRGLFCGILIVALVMFTGESSFSACIEGSGHSIKDTRALKGFDDISFEGKGNLFITQGDSESVTVNTDENLVKLVKTEVKANQLRIYFDKNICPKTMNIYVMVKDLKNLVNRGVGPVKVKGVLNCESVNFILEGSGTINVENIDATNIHTSISGNGDITIKGKSFNSLNEIDGVGNIDAFGLDVQNSIVSISGSGNAKVKPEMSLRAEIDGNGNIIYKGKPKKIMKNVTGHGSVKQD